MKKTRELITGAALFVLGIALFGGGVYLLKDKIEFFNRSVQTEGIVIEVIESGGHRSKTYYHPLISFIAVDGNTYTFSSETGTSSAFDFNKGDKLMVRYVEEDPQLAKVDSFMELWSLPLALMAAGIVLLLSGGDTVFNFLNKLKLRKELPRSGTRLQLAGRVESKNSKSKSEFVIIADWLNPTDSKIYTFTSDKISFDPTTYITNKLMDVWIDPMSPKKKHYMDISFLPKKA